MGIYFYDGGILFDSGKVAFDEGCCCEEYPCVLCSGDTPDYLEAVISGTTDGWCGNCEWFNDTHILEYLGGLPGPGLCYWGAYGPVCDAQSYGAFTVLAYVFQDAGVYYLGAKLRAGDFGVASEVFYRKNMGLTSPDCTAFSSEVLSYLGGSAGPQCDDTTTLSIAISTV